MKLIMENWRKNILLEQEQIETVGDLLKLFQYAILAKTDEKATKRLKGIGYDVILDMVPFGGASASIIDLAFRGYKLPDSPAVSKTGLKHLNIDKGMSAVVDDQVENQFLNYWADELMKIPRDTKLSDIDTTELLSKFIKDEYGRTVVEPGKGSVSLAKN